MSVFICMISFTLLFQQRHFVCEYTRLAEFSKCCGNIQNVCGLWTSTCPYAEQALNSMQNISVTLKKKATKHKWKM